MFAIPVDYVEDFFLGVAIRHFAARGLADASVNEIADEAGLSRSAMCNYFDGRNDLVDAVGVAAVGKASAALGDPAKAWDLVAVARGCHVPDTDQQRDWIHRYIHRPARG